MDKNLKKIIDLPKRLLVDEPLNLYTGIRGMFRESQTIAGLPPGQAVYTGVSRDQPFTMSVFVYDEHSLEEQSDLSLEKLKALDHQDKLLWLNIEGIHHVEQVKAVCDYFEIHPLTLEDILTVEQRLKLDDTANYIYTALRMLQFKSASRKTVSEQVSIILMKDVLITFQENLGDNFDQVRERLRIGKGRIRSAGSDYLYYALIDTVVDHYFIVME